MRVLLLTNTLGKFNEVNGVNTTYQNLLPYYKKNNIEVDIIVYGPKNNVTKDGCITIYEHKPILPLKIDNNYPLGIFLSIPLFRDIFRKDYDLIHIATPDSIGMFGVFLHNAKKIPAVYYFHTNAAGVVFERVKKKMGERIASLPKTIVDHYSDSFCNQTNMVLVENKNYYAELSQELKVPVRYIENGVDIELFNPNKKTVNNKIPIILYVGRVTKEKNMDFIKRLITKLNTDFKLKIIGDGDYLGKIKQVHKEAIFTGNITHDKLATEYANADIFIFPSLIDSLGLVVREAMSSGLPVVAFDVDGPRSQIRHGINGFLAKNENEFTNYVEELLADPEKAKDVGKKARETAQGFSFENTYNQIMNCYNEVINAHH